MVVADGAVRRIWMNISQEGSSCIDDLREGGHINGLKVQTKEFLNQTMFQVQVLDVLVLLRLPADPLKVVFFGPFVCPRSSIL